MEILDQPYSNQAQRQINFYGSGSKFFAIWIVNALLTVVTLGLYYPWARAATLRYFYEETALENSRFRFHGTGAEMFLGFIRAVGIIVLLYLMALALSSMGGLMTLLGILLFFGGGLALLPYALHGAAKYRASRSSWRGIHFGYRGNLGELIRICFVGGFLTLITFGIYWYWLTCSIRRYMVGNLRFGNIEFKHHGDGATLFGIHFGGIILTFLTLGIYVFWYQKDVFNFYVNNLSASQNGKQIQFRSKATGGGFLVLMVVNLLLLFFTLGLAFPWVIMRTMRFAIENIEINGVFNLDELVQTEAEYKDATGEDLVDMMDLGF